MFLRQRALKIFVVSVEGRGSSERWAMRGGMRGAILNIYPGTRGQVLNRSRAQEGQFASENLIRNYFFLQKRRKERVDEDKDKFCIGTE